MTAAIYTLDHADGLRSALSLRIWTLGAAWCALRAWQHAGRPRLPEDIAALLGHTTALNVLLGANQKGSGRVTLQVQGSGPVKLLVADCTAELRIRGMASYEKDFEGSFREKPAGRRPACGDAGRRA